MPRLTLPDVADVITAICEFMNTVNQQVFGSETLYHPTMIGDGHALLFHIQSAKELFEVKPIAFSDPDRAIRILKGLEQPR